MATYYPRPKGQHHAEWSPSKERSSTQWAKHDCDMDKARHGKLYATRGVTAHWGGAYAEMIRNWTVANFKSAKGLKRKPLAYTLYVQGKFVGGTDDIQYGIAWSRAATKFGLDATLVQE